MKTLVLIESDPLTRTLLAQCLHGHGWNVVEADNGNAGLELAQQLQPDAVLCDIRASKRNGFKVCRVLREQPQYAGTQMILTSVSRFANDRETALQAGADDFLVKPIIPQELLRILARPDGKPPTPETEPTVTEWPAGPTKIRFWGVRGSIPSPGQETAMTGGNTSCIEVRVAGQVIILDAGSGIRRLGQALMKEFQGRELDLTILITHTHWDHIQGFPFFLPAYSPAAHVRILGYEGAVHGLRGALFEQMGSAFFPVGLNQMASHVTFEELNDMQFQLGPLEVRSFYANHPGICLGYRLNTPDGGIVYLPDHEVYERAEAERQKAGGEILPASITHARQQDEKVIEFVRDADVLIVDSQYDATEYPSRLGWGHTCADDSVQMALRAGVKRLFLFHHDPDHTDEKIASMVAHAEEQVKESGQSLQVAAAREGLEVVLEPRAR